MTIYEFYKKDLLIHEKVTTFFIKLLISRSVCSLTDFTVKSFFFLKMANICTNILSLKVHHIGAILRHFSYMRSAINTHKAPIA